VVFILTIHWGVANVFDLPRETDWSSSVVYDTRLRPGSHGIWVDYLESGQLRVLLVVLRMNRLAVIAHMS
jgi:hypothetical protein